MTGQDEVLELLGVGFGPAAIAVAAAIEDEIDALGPRSICAGSAEFLERATTAAWQPNMLLDGTDIQHHFLRDFATPRNPRSRFTFPQYLVETGRFFPFTLMGNYVSRHEWSEYVLWAANQVTLPVRYDTEVVAIEPVVRAGEVVAATVLSRHTGTGLMSERRARNVLISTGHTPFVPDTFAPHLGERVFHSATFLSSIAGLRSLHRPRIGVIGAGQNAGEVILQVAKAFPDAEVHSIVRNSGFRMYNLGHFSNEAYFPEETDYFFALAAPDRQRVFDEMHSTNYACIDPDLSTALYRAVYDDRNWGERRLHMHKRKAVIACEARRDGGFRLGIREVNTGEADVLDVDVLILCTGYREPKLPAMLNAFDDHIERDEIGDPFVTRAFRLEMAPGCHVGLYLNGITEWRHGINSATSFSTMAIKAAEIIDDLRQRTAAPTARTNGSVPARVAG